MASSLTTERSDDKHEGFTKGDWVYIKVDHGQLQQLQEMSCGWTDSLGQCIGLIGEVQSVTDKGDVIVTFGSKFTLNPDAVTKIELMKLGDKVRVTKDASLFETLQKQSGNYDGRMKTILGKVGEVISTDSDGDLVVKFQDGRKHILNPACIRLFHGEDFSMYLSPSDKKSFPATAQPSPSAKSSASQSSSSTSSQFSYADMQAFPPEWPCVVSALMQNDVKEMSRILQQNPELRWNLANYFEGFS